MSYVRGRTGLGLSLSDLLTKGKQVVTTADTALNAAGKILDDPALPEVAGLVLKLHTLQTPKPRAGQPAPPTAPGIGLSKIVKPLRLYVYSQENTWVIPAVIGGVLAIPFLLGRMSKRGR